MFLYIVWWITWTEKYHYFLMQVSIGQIPWRFQETTFVNIIFLYSYM
jgi:hypothetical protein